METDKHQLMYACDACIIIITLERANSLRKFCRNKSIYN